MGLEVVKNSKTFSPAALAFQGNQSQSGAFELQMSEQLISIPVSAIPMLMTGALCFFGKSPEVAVKVKLPSSFLVIL